MRYGLMQRRAVMIFSGLLLAVVFVSAAACGTGEASGATVGEPRQLMVAAAASLTVAFTELGEAFDTANNTKTTFTFDASGTLQTQIQGGAPADVFASAAWKQVNNLLDKGLVDEASTVVFASNEMVLGVPADSALTVTSFQDLTKEEVQKITTADPGSAPQGKVAVETLTSLGILEAVQPKLIYSKNASQTLTYVKEGEVDVGIMYSTDAVAGGDEIRVVATSEPGWHSEIAYVLTTVTASEAKDVAQQFIDFVLGPEGQQILLKHGFMSPPQG